MLPIRCFTCNKVLGRYNMVFERYKREGKEMSDFFSDCDIRRYCCKKIFITHIDIYQYEPEIEYGNIEIRSGNVEKKIIKAD